MPKISDELVEAIRTFGHDCLDASTLPQRLADLDVLRRAGADGRVVVTADKDFGELVFVHRIECVGVVLIRLSAADETERVAHLQAVWPLVLACLPNAFVTIARGGVRTRPII